MYYIASGKTVKCEDNSQVFNFQEEITGFAFSSQGFIIGFDTGRVFRAHDLAEIESNLLASLLGRVNSIFARDDLVAAAGLQENIQVIQGNMEKSLRINRGSAILTVTISPNKVHVAAIAEDGHLYFFSNLELKYSNQVCLKKITNNTLERFICDFSPDSSKLGIPGDMLLRCIESSKVYYFETQICKKSNISIIKWPTASITILACIDNTITVNDIEKDSVLYTFSLSSSIWDFIYYENRVIAAYGEKVEIFKDVVLEKPEIDDDSEKSDLPEKEAEKQLFDRTIGVYPQEPIMPVIDDKAFCVLFRSTLGTVMSREFNSGVNRISKIEIEFDDASFHSHVSIPNNETFVLAYMNENGVLLASQNFEAGLEDFVADSKTSMVYFQGFKYEVSWSVYLPGLELPESLCVCNVCIVYTSLNYLRIFNLGGIQQHVLSMTGPVVSLSSHNSTLALVYHSAAPVLSCQSITAEFWYMTELSVQSEAEFFKEDFKIALTPESNLVWAGFSDSGNYFTVDSSNIVRSYWKRASAWVPVCTLDDFVRVIGVTDDSVLINPKESPKLIESVSFSVPLCKSKANDYEQMMITEHLKLENNKDSLDKKRKIAELDKVTFEKFMNVVDDGELDLGFGLALQASQEKTGILCIKYGQSIKSYTIVNNLAKFLGLSLPSRLARPEKIFAEPQVISVVEDNQPKNEVAKENEIEKTQQPKNPFSKASNSGKDLFEALSTNTKRKPEGTAGPTKKMKK